MSTEKGPAKIKVKEFSSGMVNAKDLEILVGRLAMEDEWAPQGPTPFPHLLTLRKWDKLLLNRYKPFYAPLCDMCCMCTYGKCDLSRGKKGACGITIKANEGRTALLTCCIGASSHTAHSKHMVDYLIKKHGEDYKLDLGKEIDIEAPHARLITGIKPRTLGDLSYILKYCDDQIIHALAATHSGNEGSFTDFESKALHVGMIDHLSMEIADIAQIVTMGFPKGDSNVPYTEAGLGTVDITKPVILLIGHNVAHGVELADYMRKSGLGNPGEKIEIGGLCCTAHDMTRHSHKAKIIGPQSQQIKFIRSGIADVIITDEQCIRTDVVNEASAVKTPVISVSDKACFDLTDMTNEPVEVIVSALTEDKLKGAVILDLKKAGMVAAQVAMKVVSKRMKYKVIPDHKKTKELASQCTNCERCRRNCPSDLVVNAAVFTAKDGHFSKLSELHDTCIGCARCESVCPQNIPIISLMEAAAQAKIKTDRHKIRIGRGPILDTEIRNVGSAIVLGEIPGVVAYVGCPNYPSSGVEVGEMAYEFAKRGYIVLTSGCAATSLAAFKDEDGKSPYEVFSGNFERGGLINVGSCVTNAHITGAAIKIANIFARRNLRGNYEEIADYTLNRIGAVGIVWGSMCAKAFSIGTGVNRLGIPVLLGPQGAKHRRLYLGRVEDTESFKVYDARTGERPFIGPAPEHLNYVAESKEECMVLTAKSCIRPNDTTKGRMIKLTHYAELYKKFYGTFPEDIQLLVRTDADIPITYKEEIKEFLQQKGWKPSPHPTVDPTLLERLIRSKK